MFAIRSYSNGEFLTVDGATSGDPADARTFDDRDDARAHALAVDGLVTEITPSPWGWIEIESPSEAFLEDGTQVTSVAHGGEPWCVVYYGPGDYEARWKDAHGVLHTRRTYRTNRGARVKAIHAWGR